MQRYLLPQLPHVPGLETTSRYLPAPDASHVGGDWYDAFSLGDGDTALVIGDVSGHDLDAAAGMAQLRNVLRSYAWSSRHESPGRVVERVDRAVLRITDVSMATLVLAVLGTDEEGRWTLSWTNAGHPPPLLVTREGVAGYLTDGGGMLLGTGTDRPRADGSTVLPPGSTLVLYTDGLIEAPSHPIDEGLERLRLRRRRARPSPGRGVRRRTAPPGTPRTTTTTSPSSWSASAPAPSTWSDTTRAGEVVVRSAGVRTRRPVT